MTGVDYDVAIVGHGPVGSALAILLAQRGRSVVVLERWPQPYPLPRAVHYDHEAGRILQSCGIGDALGGISEAAEVYEWRNGSGTALLRFGRRGLGASGWPQSSMFHQPAFEGLLAERVAELPSITVRRGFEVTGLDRDSTCVTLRGRSIDGIEEAVTSRFAVGCDGANSTVRDLIESPVHDLGFFYDWLIVDVVLDEPRVFDPPNLQICDPSRPSTAVSGGPGRRRWEFMRLPDETIDELNDEKKAWALLAPWDVHPGNARLDRHTVYTFQARWVETWRSERVFLAGDAAHQMPPFAGQGMCAGLRDAANLAWKLDLVVDGRAGDHLLDTYQTERAANVAAVIDFSIELGKVICVDDPLQATARDEVMSAGLVAGEVTLVPELPGIDDGLIDRASPHAGRLFVQGFMESRGQRIRFDDAVGAGWRLVTTTRCADVDLSVATWFASIGGRIVQVGDDSTLSDPDGTYKDWFATHGVVAVLQRPDFYVYGTAVDAPGAVALLRRLRSDLTPRRHAGIA